MPQSQGALTAAEIDPLARRCIATGAALMLLAVILGAFGAHGLEARLPARQLASYHTGVTYQSLHSLGLVLVGIVAQATGTSRWLAWSARLMLAGIVLFSGSIYGLVLGSGRWLGTVTPLGGVALMAGWISLWFLARPH